MKYLEPFGNYNDSETLYIFDLDDTIVENIPFNNLAIEFLKEGVTIEKLLLLSLRKIDKKISDLKWENGRIYIEDAESKILVDGNWVRKGKRVYLITPDKFYFTDISLPNKLKTLSNFYNSVRNKCIVTGRSKEMKSKLEESISKLGLGYPNYGFHCYPTNTPNTDKVATWKAKTIVSLIKSCGFKKAEFYDDNVKWVKKAVDMVNQELPNVSFKGIKVKK